MRILLKYTLKSIGERKFRAFLIIFAIALSCGLFLASTRLSDNIGTMFLDKIKSIYGTIDLMVYPKEHSGQNFVSMTCYDEVADEIEAAIPSVASSGTYKLGGKNKSWNISISGYNVEDYLKFNKLKILEGDTSDFRGNQIILSEQALKELGFKVGDSFEMDISGAKRKVTICAMADKVGMFSDEKNGFVAMMPFDTISRYNHTNGKPSTLYLVAKKGANVKALLETIEMNHSMCKVEQPFDEETIKQELSSITVPFLMMTCIVVFMSAFIIYSCFKVIMLEKLPVVGTFRSIGADKKMMNRVLLLEALFYGAAGGLFACLLGIGCLLGLEKMMSGMIMDGASDISLDVPMSSFITTFALGVGMAVLSTIAPILSVSKISLKDIILNNRPHKKSKTLRNCIIGIVFIIISFIIASAIQGNIAILTTLLGFFLLIIGVIKILPIIVLGLSKALGVVFQTVFGNIGELATKNIKKNKSVLNSITLITIGMSILLTISTMTKNMQITVFDVYGDLKCEVMGYVDNFSDQRLKMLRRINGVDNIIECIEEYRKVNEFEGKNIYIEAISTTKLMPYVDFNVAGDEEALLKKLQTGRYMILNDFLQHRYNVKEGDVVTLDFDGKPREYTIIGFMDTQWNNSQMALVPIKYYRQDASAKQYSWFYMGLKPGADAAKVIKDIEDHINGDYSRIDTVQNFAINNAESNNQIMSMISVFAILAMVIGIVGVLNNLMISFIERKQNIAMLRSIGMSKLQVLKMIFIEGLGSGLVGAITGIGSGILCCKIFEYVIMAMDLELEMKIIPGLFVSYLISGMLITIIGSIIPARGSSKLNIIEAIKYE